MMSSNPGRRRTAEKTACHCKSSHKRSADPTALLLLLLPLLLSLLLLLLLLLLLDWWPAKRASASPALLQQA
jgi:hypothetical protein